MAGTIRIGTSGWVYSHWRGIFYPKGLPQARWFAFYAREFPTVEINGTFYREASEAAVTGWREQAPAGFVYGVKAHRFMTHMKKLIDCADPVRRFFARMDLLGDRLGPVLYQLAPQVRVDAERLAAFAALLPEQHLHVFEFRDDRWFTPELRRLLERQGLAFCVHDARGLDCPDWVTADAAYYRFHGPAGDYSGSYDDAALRAAARRIEAKAAAGHDVYVYFNNDLNGCAVTDARRLREMTGAQGLPAASTHRQLSGR